jgi:hypothetical protein
MLEVLNDMAHGVGASDNITGHMDPAGHTIGTDELLGQKNPTGHWTGTASPPGQ